MSVFGISDGVVMGLLTVSTAVLLACALYLVLRSGAEREAEPEIVREERALPLEHVLQEGFEIIEIYDDAVTVNRPTRDPPRVLSRTAKVRDPDSGGVRLLRVLTPTQRAR